MPTTGLININEAYIASANVLLLHDTNHSDNTDAESLSTLLSLCELFW